MGGHRIGRHAATSGGCTAIAEKQMGKKGKHRAVHVRTGTNEGATSSTRHQSVDDGLVTNSCNSLRLLMLP